ncbi:Uncharacterised protein [uncultured archaeon]|nr:Uncharacterised protein [uncultured archaeon]
MVSWKKTELLNSRVNFNAVEDMLSDILDTFDAPDLDLTKPIRIGFMVSLDGNGLPHIKELELMTDLSSLGNNLDAPLIDLIELDREINVVIDAAKLPAQDLGVKVMDNHLLVTNRRFKSFIRKVSFPCTVIPGAARLIYNNNVLEVKVPKVSGTYGLGGSGKKQAMPEERIILPEREKSK